MELEDSVHLTTGTLWSSISSRCGGRGRSGLALMSALASAFRERCSRPRDRAICQVTRARSTDPRHALLLASCRARPLRTAVFLPVPPVPPPG